MPRKASPLSSTSIGNLLGAIFFFTNMLCVLLGASCIIFSLFVSMPQSSLLYTSFERAIHDLEIVRILYVLHLYLLSYVVLLYVPHLYLFELSSFALCASLISFERYNFALCASLRSFRAGWWLVLKKL